MTKKTGHGGKRADAGRKPTGLPIKTKKTYALNQETLARLDELKAESGHSYASIIEYAIKRIRTLPKRL